MMQRTSQGELRRPVFPSSRRSTARLLACLGIAMFCLWPGRAFADPTAPASPKQPWGDFEVVEESVERPFWQQVLLWPVNRVVDLYEVFRIDVGAGISKGGVVRITKYGQMGYRSMDPGSLRIGTFGRDYPFLLETSNEFGFGPGYVNSEDREVCPGALGAGLDLYLVGAYAGICVDELFDFLLGIVFLDPKDDDIR